MGAEAFNRGDWWFVSAVAMLAGVGSEWRARAGGAGQVRWEGRGGVLCNGERIALLGREWRPAVGVYFRGRHGWGGKGGVWWDGRYGERWGRKGG